MTARLISIPASNYVEKVRWALQLVNVPFVEDKFLLVVHAFDMRLKGGDIVPLLYFPASKKALTDSSDILDFCVQELPSLYPTEGSKALELYYDKELGGGAAKLIECVGRMIQEADEKFGNTLIDTRFLAGEAFSAADIAFCAHMLLIVIPPKHAHIGFVTLANFDYPLRARIEKLQCTKSGEFVGWCYKHKRPAIP